MLDKRPHTYLSVKVRACGWIPLRARNRGEHHHLCDVALGSEMAGGQDLVCQDDDALPGLGNVIAFVISGKNTVVPESSIMQIVPSALIACAKRATSLEVIGCVHSD